MELSYAGPCSYRDDPDLSKRGALGLFLRQARIFGTVAIAFDPVGWNMDANPFRRLLWRMGY
jgi:hypothetical protein